MKPKGYSNSDILQDVVRFSEEIESMFGFATNVWELKGVEFKDEDSSPCIFYPINFSGAVMIHLTANAVNNVDYARFQLAHELVHCLSPSGTAFANVFEEGMAAWYQQRIALTKLNKRVKLNDERYIAARILFNRMKKKDKGAVKALRLVEPRMWKIDETTFNKANVNLDVELIRTLVMPFSEFMC